MAMTSEDMAVAIADLRAQDLRASEKIDRVAVIGDANHTMLVEIQNKMIVHDERALETAALIANLNRVVIASKMLGSLLKFLVMLTIGASAFAAALSNLKIHIPFIGKFWS